MSRISRPCYREGRGQDEGYGTTTNTTSTTTILCYLRRLVYYSTIVYNIIFKRFYYHTILLQYNEEYLAPGELSDAIGSAEVVDELVQRVLGHL